MNAPRITGEHSKLLIHMAMRAFLLDVAIYTPTIKDLLLPLYGDFFILSCTVMCSGVPQLPKTPENTVIVCTQN